MDSKLFTTGTRRGQGKVPLFNMRRFMENWKTIIKWVLIGFGLVFCVLAGVLYFWLPPTQFKPPTDEKIITLFHQHKASFEKLNEMSSDDARKGLCFSPFFSEPLKQVGASRAQEYKTLLDEIFLGLELEPGNSKLRTGNRFVFTYSGCAICDDREKGIDFIPRNFERFGEVVQSLDKTDDLPPGNYLCQIEPHWFIFYYYYKE
jgi:hypothetical protein